ncbi:bacterial membrane protein YfhO [Variibacter gotjawalensis]|uniref:Bacterial membrane protein YfhO n=1 Tax=Variibacter gotjawalensis TaxID=1333996 RepID=A0A0S3PX43_9BRAD|nr:hypothetical protein [Variibacter gotjawalensis]NIK46327.1 hypothetical protein [Variibacter gotjawalensis]RZS48237.1 hypothetical protein EV661_0643 [Variibacter gotjawalensis]BAT60497.1 bacterial membrane protein YfhO [Variibacter gotjawalensis]
MTRRELASTLAFLTAAALLLAWPWLSGAVTVPWDAKSQFFPAQAFLARALATGQSPFWTADAFAGWPEIADPQSLIFSIPHLILAWLQPTPGFRAVDGVSFATLGAGALGIVMIFRDRRWHSAGALVAALAFMFGGVCASRIQHTGEVMSAAYFPLALWLLLRTLERRSITYAALCGVAVAAIASGRDQVAMIGLYLLALFVLLHWLDGADHVKRVVASIKPLFVCGVIAVLLAIIPIVLTWLLAGESNRPEIIYAEAARGSLHPMHLLTLAFSDLYGAVDESVPYWGPASYPWGETGLVLAQNMAQLYAGALPLVALIGLALTSRSLWQREVRCFTIACIAAILFALGWYTPLFRVAYEAFPGISYFRRPADAAFLFCALFAIVAGYSVHRLLMIEERAFRRAIVAALIALLAAISAALAGAIVTGTLRVALWPVAVGTAFLIAAIATLWFVRRTSPSPLLAAALLAAFMAADLSYNNGPNVSTGLAPDNYEELLTGTRNKTVALLKSSVDMSTGGARRDRIEVAAIEYHWPSLGLVHGFESLFAQNPLRLRDFQQVTGVGDTVAVAEQRTFSPLFPSYRSTMADLLGLRFLALGVPAEQIDKKLSPGDLKLLARTEDAYVYENPRALPRVMIVPGARQAEFVDLVRTGWPDGVDPRKGLLLNRAPPLADQARREGTATIRRYTNTEAVIEADAADGGYLLLNDVWHPWWRATIDGTATEILKANVMFRAIVLPPGKHTVRFTYHPFIGAWQQLRRKLGLT